VRVTRKIKPKPRRNRRRLHHKPGDEVGGVWTTVRDEVGGVWK
jgi:hypothetical protein